MDPIETSDKQKTLKDDKYRKIMEVLQEINNQLVDIKVTKPSEKDDLYVKSEEKSEILDKVTVQPQSILSETPTDVDKIGDAAKTIESQMDNMNEILEHTNDMMDGLVSMYKAREYRREHGYASYRRKYYGEDFDF